ncbi:MAG: hypothetical protein E7394_05690 [Ruminococcaceae bacterium]|nr:hypothetical protein [Oscillospiraceae bacterium]
MLLKEEINLIKIFEIILRLWWIVLIFAIVGSIIAYSISAFLITPEYTATARVYVAGGERLESLGYNINDINTDKSLVATYVEFFSSNAFLEGVANDYNSRHPKSAPISGNDIKSGIVMSAANETQVMQIEYTDISSVRSKEILDIFLEEGHAQTEITRFLPGCKVVVSDPPVLPKTQSAPNTEQNTFIGMFLGVILGIAVIFLKELLDMRIKDVDDLKTRYSQPVLGIIPNLDVE